LSNLIKNENELLEKKDLICNLEMTLLSARMSDYPTITQGKTRIPGINDGEEFEITDVSFKRKKMREDFKSTRVNTAPRSWNDVNNPFLHLFGSVCRLNWKKL
jgi:hypothetical protein